MRIRAFSKCSVLLVLSWLISSWNWLSVLVVTQHGLLGLLVLIVLFVLNILVFDGVLSRLLFLLLLETHAVNAAEEEGGHDGAEEWSNDVGWQVGEHATGAGWGSDVLEEDQGSGEDWVEGSTGGVADVGKSEEDKGNGNGLDDLILGWADTLLADDDESEDKDESKEGLESNHLELLVSSGLAVVWLSWVLWAKLGDEHLSNTEGSLSSVSSEAKVGEENATNSSDHLGDESSEEVNCVSSPVLLNLVSFIINTITLSHLSEPNSECNTWVEVSTGDWSKEQVTCEKG